MKKWIAPKRHHNIQLRVSVSVSRGAASQKKTFRVLRRKLCQSSTENNRELCRAQQITMAEEDDVYDEENKNEENDEPPPTPSFDMEDVMESMTRITFCGLGGTIVGLSLEKRLESMKITTAEGVAAAARRKRGKTVSSHQQSFPLSATWAVSCMVFCSIIEVSRLVSPSTWVVKQLEAAQGTSWNISKDGETSKSTAAAISVADYSIGGAIAGVVCSFGRQMYSRNAVVKMHSPRRFSGLLPGLAIGVAAGTIQSAIDYGTDLLRESGATE